MGAGASRLAAEAKRDEHGGRHDSQGVNRARHDRRSITPHARFEAQVYALRTREGGRHKPLQWLPAQFFFRTTDVNGILVLDNGSEMVMPGHTASMLIELGRPIAMDEGLGFAGREGGKTVAAGNVTRVLD